MRFMVMHKLTEELEKGLKPDPAIIESVGQFVSDAVKEKIFISGEGLKPSSERVHIAYRKGKRTLENGPFADVKELVGGFALLRVRSKDEAVARADELARVSDGEIIVGPVVEPWDLGMMPKPKNPPARFLALAKIDERSENEMPPDPSVEAKLRALIDEMSKAGVLQASGALASTKKGARIRFEGGKRTVLDGPFAESKELVSGYAMLELPSKAVAIEWALRYGEIVRVNEVEVRQVSGAVI
jgi:hypothetical protein